MTARTVALLCVTTRETDSMSTKIFLIAGTIAATLLLGACRTAPIYNVEAQPIAVSASTYTVEDVRNAVIRAGSRRGWTFQDAGEGKLVGMIALRKHRATIDVRYDRETFDITYRDSEDLNYSEGQGVIHTNYNSWVQNLARDINLELTLL